jgi:hypothetical protein
VLCCPFRKPADHAEPQSNCRPPPPRDRFERAFPMAGVHIDRPDKDGMLPGVGDELGWRVKPHGLAVEEASQKRLGVMTLDPA